MTRGARGVLRVTGRSAARGRLVFRPRRIGAGTARGQAGARRPRGRCRATRVQRVAGLGSFISVGKSLDQALERVKRADELGYDSAYVTHIAGRDSLTLLMAYAAATENIKLGTGVLPIYSRTPVATAQQAATIDEFSGGRMVLGLGVSHAVTVENWYGTKIERPVSAMREYVAGRARDVRPATTPPQGEFFPTNFRFMGYEPRADLPDLRRRAVAEHAAARRRGRGRRDAVAVQPGLHPRRGDARGAGRPRARRQEHGRVRRRGRRAGRRDRRPRRPPTRPCAATWSPTGACPSTAR